MVRLAALGRTKGGLEARILFYMAESLKKWCGFPFPKVETSCCTLSKAKNVWVSSTPSRKSFERLLLGRIFADIVFSGSLPPLLAAFEKTIPCVSTHPGTSCFILCRPFCHAAPHIHGEQYTYMPILRSTGGHREKDRILFEKTSKM